MDRTSRRQRSDVCERRRTVCYRLLRASVPLCLCACLGVILAGGCQGLGLTTEGTDEPEPLAAAEKTTLPDFPLPSGFELVADRSSDYVDTQTRFAAHEYMGRASVYAVRDFYRERLQKTGWKWLVEMTSFGERYLVFENEFVDKSTGRTGREWCWLNMKQIESHKTRLRINLTPAPGPTE